MISVGIFDIMSRRGRLEKSIPPDDCAYITFYKKRINESVIMRIYIKKILYFLYLLILWINSIYSIN